jgi:hypothetical protein
MMLNPVTPKTNATYNYATDKIHYSHDISGIHFVFVNMWPDSAERVWLSSDLASVSASTPVLLFTHDQPAVESKHFTNPNGSHDINATAKFENLLTEWFKDGTTITPAATIEQNALGAYLAAHTNIIAYFHGNDNANEYYMWNGVNVYRVDSPMKGNFSVADETKLSFQLVTIDTASQKMTVRECLWNDSSSATKPIKFGLAKTISLMGTTKTRFSDLVKYPGNNEIAIFNANSQVRIMSNAANAPMLVKITTITGRTIHSYAGIGNSYTWNYAKDHLSKGVYMISVTSGNHMKSAKVCLVR